MSSGFTSRMLLGACLVWVCTMASADSLPGRADYETWPAVELNGRTTDVVPVLLLAGSGLFLRREDLDQLGVITSDLVFETGKDGTQRIELGAIGGLSYQFDESAQLLHLTVSPERLQRQYLGRGVERPPVATAGTGVLLNYDGNATLPSNGQGARSVAVWTEARFFNSAGYLSSTGVSSRDEGMGASGPGYLRYDTQWQHADPASLQTWTVGDQLTSSTNWSRSVRLGGVGLARDFSLRPDLITFPLPALGGSALVPSSVDLYLNGVRTYNAQDVSGPFGFNMPPAITGAGNATVVVTDALGRSVTTTVPLYVDARLLAQGQSDYGLSAGYIRRDYGVDSNHYAPNLAANASGRYGWSNTVTLEGHAEASAEIANLGMGGLLQLGQAGVVRGALAASNGGGTQWQLGYQWIGKPLSVNLQMTRASGNYTDLAASEGSPILLQSYQASLGVPLFSSQSINLSVLGQNSQASGASRVYAVSWSLQGQHDWSVYLNGYRDAANPANRGVYASLAWRFGRDINASLSASKSADAKPLYGVDIASPVAYAGGWGWRLNANNADFISGRLDYRNRWADGYFAGQRDSQSWTSYAGLAGAVVFMDNTLLATRRVDDGFALVSTDGMAQVPVLVENRLLGTTDASGHLLVPDLNAYQNNRIAIDPLGVNYDLQLNTTALDLAPQKRSGVFARFQIQRFQAASFNLVDASGVPLPLGNMAILQETGETVPVGYDGAVFFNQMPATAHITVQGKSPACVAMVAFDIKLGGLQQLGAATCLPTGTP